MRKLSTFAFAFLGFALTGCYDNHGRFVPVMPTGDAGPVIVSDAGPMMVTPDAGPVTPDSGPVVVADAGSDACGSGMPSCRTSERRYADRDGDGHGDPDDWVFVGVCCPWDMEHSLPWIEGRDMDCDDGRSDTYPGAEELPDGVDNDCDGETDESEFVFEAFNMPPPGLVVGGNVTYNVSARFHVSPGESLASVDVVLDGDYADVIEFGIFDQDFHQYGRGFFPPGRDTTAHVELTERFTSPMDAPRVLEVLTVSPGVVTNTTSGGVHDGFAMSGDSFRVGINTVERYIGSARRRTIFPAIMGNEFVIRRAIPMFTNLTAPSASIANGIDTVLNHTSAWAIVSASVSPFVPARVSLRREGMVVEINSAAGTVCDVGLRRDSTELVWGVDYVLRHGPDGVIDPSVCWDASDARLVIYFVNEEILTREGAHYYLHGTPSGFVAGDSIEVNFDQSADYETITGYLGRFGGFAGNDQNVDISPLGSPADGIGYGASFIWSDLSEVPHVAQYGFDGGSRDWTNGYLVPGLIGPATILTR